MKKAAAGTDLVEPVKVSVHQKKKKLVVRFIDTPEPFTIKVKSDVKKGKPLIISAKSSKSDNVGLRS